MDEIMKEKFVPQLNEFIELHKQARKMHSEYILSLSEWQKQLIHESKKLQLDLQLMEKTPSLTDYSFQTFRETQFQHGREFDQAVTDFRGVFKDFVEDANLLLGRISNHWGGYIEGIGVQYLLNTLRRELGVHTFIEKFRRYWGKTRNLEIDLLAISDDTCYVVEVKTHLKEDILSHLQVNLEKFRDKVPEYGHLKLQPIMFCLHISPGLLAHELLRDWWIIHYKNFEPDKPQNTFEWLKAAPPLV